MHSNSLMSFFYSVTQNDTQYLSTAPPPVQCRVGQSLLSNGKLCYEGHRLFTVDQFAINPNPPDLFCVAAFQLHVHMLYGLPHPRWRSQHLLLFSFKQLVTVHLWYIQISARPFYPQVNLQLLHVAILHIPTQEIIGLRGQRKASQVFQKDYL